MAYRNKTYIAFDGDKDMRYYRLMTAWSANPAFEFDIHDAHELNSARDSSQEASIKRQLRDRLANSKAFVVLIGESTRYLTKFVKWEIESALNLALPIIAVNLNGSRVKDDRCPPVLADELAVFVPFNEKIITLALRNWPEEATRLKSQGVRQSRSYSDNTYASLGL